MESPCRHPACRRRTAKLSPAARTRPFPENSAQGILFSIQSRKRAAPDTPASSFRPDGEEMPPRTLTDYPHGMRPKNPLSARIGLGLPHHRPKIGQRLAMTGCGACRFSGVRTSCFRQAAQIQGVHMDPSNDPSGLKP
jgi:hypothetical protein